MANAVAEPLLQTEAPPEDDEGCVGRAKAQGKAGLKQVCKYLGIGFAMVCLLSMICQAVAFYAVTLGCGPKAIGQLYSFPGGGDSDFGGARYNLLPADFLLSERERTFWGWPLDVIPANIAAAASGAQVGTWWRNNGPLFYTYTYEDIANSKLTVYMRSNFWAPWMSYRIARCDGKGPVITFTESGFWIHNRIRSLFRMNQAQSYSIFSDGEKVAEAQEVTTGFPSLTISNQTTGAEISSSILSHRHFHGDKDQWYVHNHRDSGIPYYVSAAISLPFAFDAMAEKTASKIAATTGVQKTTPAPTFLLKPLATPAVMKKKLPALNVIDDAKEETAVTASTAKAEHHV